MNPEIKQRLEDYITKRGLRRTAQRDIIVEAAFATDDHFTAEELWEKARKLDPKTSRATVYRTISLLKKCDLLREIDLGRDERVYDPNFNDSPDHSHLICVDCGRVLEFENDEVGGQIDKLTSELGFVPSTKSLKIEACCSKLRAQGVCEHLLAMRLGKSAATGV